MEHQEAEFVAEDFAIFGITIFISIAIGLYYAFSGGKQKTMAEYLLGNKQMAVFPVALSLMVSFESSITMLGFPAEVYVHGIMFCLANLGFMFAIILGTRMLVPVVHPLGIKSVYEYFELRYKCRSVRLVGTTVGMLYYVFYMGIVLFGPAIALEAVTNMPLWVSVVSVAAASVLYTSIGGLKAVIWTDVFQCFVMFMGIFAVLIKGTMTAGGPKEVFDINDRNGRLYLFNFDPDPTVRHTFWSLVIGCSLRMMSLTFNQSTVQRISSMATKKDANRVLLLTGPAFFITLSLATVEGVVAYAYYTTLRCDPLTSKRLSNPNQIIPYMVLDIFRNYPGMAGLFMASLFSASLSTMSSGLSSLSALTVEDYIKPYFKNLTDKRLTLIAKLTVPFFGLVTVGVSFMIAMVPGPMSQVAASILSSFNGPAGGLFLYTVFFPWATKRGAIVGTIAGVLLTLWVGVGKNFSPTLPKTPWAPMPPTDNCPSNYNTTVDNFTLAANYSFTPRMYTLNKTLDNEPQGLDKLYSISYQWIGALGMFYTIVIGIFTSIVEGLPKSEDVDVRYVLPFFDQFFPFLPEWVKRKLYLGVKFEEREELLKTIDKGFRDYEEEVLPPNKHSDTSHYTDEPLLSDYILNGNAQNTNGETVHDNLIQSDKNCNFRNGMSSQKETKI